MWPGVLANQIVRWKGEVSAHAMPIGWVGLWDRIRTDDGEAGSWVFGSVWRVVQGREKVRVLRQIAINWMRMSTFAGARWRGWDSRQGLEVWWDVHNESHGPIVCPRDLLKVQDTGILPTVSDGPVRMANVYHTCLILCAGTIPRA